jgi:hypothetical protein
VSKSGAQNKKRIIVTKLSKPVATALVKIPFPAITLKKEIHHVLFGRHVDMVYLAFLVSSAMCPDASKPVIVPAVKRLRRCSIKAIPVSTKLDNILRQNPIPSRRSSGAIIWKQNSSRQLNGG